MNLLKVAAAALVIILVLWAVYRLGKVVLRILAGLLFITAVLACIWYLFLK